MTRYSTVYSTPLLYAADGFSRNCTALAALGILQL